LLKENVMSKNSGAAFGFCEWTRRLVVIATFLALVASAPPPAQAGSREAVKKALAATVAVEWWADEQAGQKPSALDQSTTDGQVHKEQRMEIDARTGQPTVRTVFVAQSQPVDDADLSLASGVVLSEDGLVATLIRELRKGKYTVFLEDGRSLPARLLVDDHRSGLRLLKVDADDLPHLELADADAEVGDQVFATFSTDRRRRAAAQGIVAARSRATGGSLQLDLAAGRMSSGGPVVDEQGRLAGVLSGKAARSPADDLQNFAAPLSAVRALLKGRQDGNTVVVQPGMLGVSIHVDSEGGQERLTVRPLPDSPALAAGMHDGDELVAIDGERIGSASEVAAAVATHAPGEKIVITIRREGTEQKLEIILGARPDTMKASVNAPREPRDAPPPAAANLVEPEHYDVIVMRDDKRVVARSSRLRLTTSPNGQTTVATEPLPNVIRVERSGLEKKLEEFGRNVESLQQQVEKLTEEVKSLRARLPEQK
jgi:S1-C subfamily serine protease